MGKELVKIVLADAQFLTRAGLKLLFAGQANLKVVAEATDHEELAAAIAAHSPQVVVIDHHNTNEFSLADIAWLHETHPLLNVLLITDDTDRGRIYQLLDLGVNCILTKHCSGEEIISGAIATAKREKFFCNKVLEVILEKNDAPDDSCRPSNLSIREIEIVNLIAQGVTTKVIADRLCLSTHTVYTHRKNIMKKLAINSVSEMILYALHTGISKA